ncbi:MAG: CAP domain-containing protein [Candidatus Melainabacteria bacterium]|mgnify:CR=1 FL=1|nr:CAP domain-containing protein [Candidatus Melainabacteria bacterium]
MNIRSIAIALSASILMSSAGAGIAQDALAPGPLLTKRTQILQYLNKAKSAGIGVRPYSEALDKIEAEVKEGKTEEEIKPQVDRLVSALAQQVSNLKTLKATAAARAVPVPVSAPAGRPASGGSMLFPNFGPSTAKSSAESLAGLSDYSKYALVRGRGVPESVLEQLLFELVNKHRKENKLPAYSYNSKLASLARGHARDMAHFSYLSHYNRQHQGPLERAQAAGYTDVSVSENIGTVGAGRGTPIGMIIVADDSLMKSPGHRAAILNPQFVAGGCGVAYDTASGGIKVCQVFSPTNF